MPNVSFQAEPLSFLVIAELVQRIQHVQNRRCLWAVPCDDAPLLAWRVPTQRLEIVVDGNVEMLFSEEAGIRASEQMKSGDVLVVSPCGWNLPYAQVANTLSICFKGGKLGLSYNHWQDGRCISLAKWVVEVPTMLQTAGKGEIDGLLAYIASSLKAQAMTVSKQKVLFQQILTYLRCHFNEQICRDSVAREFCISPSYLSHLFKTYGEVGFNEYVNRERFAHARHLLLEKGLRVKQVALESGFVDADYFCRMFKRLAGMTPSQYRTRHESLLF
ncbi:helix-turn-helix transcriptional regulator [Enterovibrio nigricans]|uniref:Helix-turn-helix domain-containing protein n=1 Tax=Enterovibrio nigricans DSM 22720 TaxID=1121868 RepID=A0A1T4UPJ5_9GAMM|nr:AraC family transcriptional regulator [Enterovibrio nigricans]PKF49764.1 AraC family transcriptional regulator [Enterovibrio nigricans]SKA54351.1 Helix-turn-helix domain-containing protein [Enterovibrio nigricans DSM 22720]